jgi:hypothetical protein
MDRDVLVTMASTASHLLEARAAVTGPARRSYDELFALACRKVEEIAPVNASKAASERARELGLGDLRTYCWFCPALRKHRVGVKNRRLFLWEHYVPVADTQRRLVGLGPRASLDDVADILGETKIVWVLRDEGDALGNRSRADPGRAYRDAGIDPMEGDEAPGSSPGRLVSDVVFVDQLSSATEFSSAQQRKPVE